jgi:hypothetical protein
MQQLISLDHQKRLVELLNPSAKRKKALSRLFDALLETLSAKGNPH